jgi:hypothetical protein
VEDDAEGEARTGVDAADAVADVDAIEAPGAFHRTIAGGENDRLALCGGDYLGFRLRAGLLLDEEEFAALPVAARLAQQEDHLQREGDFAVQILVEAVVAAGFVVKDERRRARLSGFVAGPQERSVI